MKKIAYILFLCAVGITALSVGVFAVPSEIAFVQDTFDAEGKYDSLEQSAQLSEYLSEGGISFCVDNNMTLTVSGEGEIKNVPEGILNERFNKLVISSGITSVSEYAFYGFDNILLVVASDTLEYIGKGAFDGTNYVETKTGAVYIGKVLYTYKGEFDIPEELVIKQDTKSIAENAISGRTEIKKVSFPDTVEIIGDNAFYGCTSLLDVTFGNNVAYVGENAFCDTAWENAQTETAIIGKSLYKYIGTDEEYEIPNTVEYISGKAFSENETLVSVVMGDSVKFICKNAFYNCENLENISFGNYIERIGENAFYGTKWLSSKPGGVVYVNDIAVLYKGVMQEYARVEIKEGTRVIENGVFRDMNNLYSLLIPESVAVIGNDALSGCLNVTVYAKRNSFAHKYVIEHSIPVREDENTDELVVFGKNGQISWALYESGKLVFDGEGCVYFPLEVDRNVVTCVEMSEGITEISQEAFAGCHSLSKISFPESLQYVGAFAFDNTLWLSDKQGAVYAGNILFAYVGEIPGGVLEIIDGTTHVTDFALSENTSLISVILPGSIVHIGMEAFSYCESLESVTGGENVKHIGTDAFWGTKFLEESIGQVYIGKTLYAYNGDVPSGTVFEIIEGTVSVSPFACYGLTGISDVVFPETLKEIGDEAFAFCSGIGRLDVPQSIEKFGENVFNGCENIKLVVSRPSAAHEYAKQSGIPFEAEGIALFGDVDGDGNISIKDVILVSMYLSGSVNLDDVQLKVCDVYTDDSQTGVVNQNDVIRLCEFLTGKKVVLG